MKPGVLLCVGRIVFSNQGVPHATIQGMSFLSLFRSMPRWRGPARYERAPHEATGWLVLEQGPNPSSDYYVRPRIGQDGLPVRWRHVEKDVPGAEDLAPGTRVVIVRYLTPAWAAALRHARHGLAGVVYFMDDELLDPSAWKTLPATYRKKLDRLCLQQEGAIAELASEYWGSTPVLCERHAERAMRLVPPLPLPEDAGRPICPVVPGEPVQIFYHGSAVHLDEMRWLRPVIAEVLSACPLAHFEVIGDQEVNRLFRDLPRTRVLHPMSWPNYLSHCRAMRGHIGLAPLLPGVFNAGRSKTKVFDIRRAGARGVFSALSPYGPDTLMAGEGLCLPMEPAVWADGLRALVQPVPSDGNRM